MPTRRAAVMSCLAVLATSTIARSDGSTESYLAARNRYVAEETAKAKAVDQKAEEIRKAKGDAASDQYRADTDKADSSRLKKELGDLQDRLVQLIGPVSVKGVPAKGEITLTELAADEGVGFGVLDGLAFRSDGNGLELVVTTDALLKNWLGETKDRIKSQLEFDMPQDVAQALRFAPFYTYAVEEDAAVEDFGELAVVPAKGDDAVAALLVEITQDRAATPSHIIGAVVRGGKIFILTQPLASPPKPFPRCDAIQADFEQRRKKVTDQEAAATDPSRPASAPPTAAEAKLLDEERKIDADGDAAYRKCFAQEVRKQSDFPAITRQAQALVDLVPGG
ncbi:MAG TPA: hypothetical protein VKS60_01580 [Stellaceae bacterium]|nr:hypothetical protein [Stellaceae bacterium]